MHTIKSEIEQEIIGQSNLIDLMLITFFTGGHALLEGVPWLWKTKTVRTFSKVIGLDTGRISFTPDLLPSDLTGNEIYRPWAGTFEVRKWPIFTNILLADEINRTPPKVQSALLEAMEEKKVTIGDDTYPLPSPFVVFATQNPLEHEGTYPLPEAQLDRFLMKITLDYPSANHEKQIFAQETTYAQHAKSAWSDHDDNTKVDFLEMIDYIATHVTVDGRIYDYISDLLVATRKLTTITKGDDYPLLVYGASTRAGLALIRASKVRAIIHNRHFVLPEDIKALAHNIIDHRIGLSYESASNGMSPYEITENILNQVPIP